MGTLKSGYCPLAEVIFYVAKSNPVIPIKGKFSIMIPFQIAPTKIRIQFIIHLFARYCIDFNIQSCDGILRAGYCPGASNILCCEPASTLPERCLGSGPDLPSRTFEFTLTNQGFAGHPGALIYMRALAGSTTSIVS